MANSLGLDDDLDGVELVQNLEKAFDIQITDAEAKRIFTVGEIYDLMLKKIPPEDTNRKCASAMTFYRLRRAIRGLCHDKKLGPATDLQFLEERRTRTALRNIERETGLRLPPAEMTWIGKLGCLMSVILLVAGGALSLWHHLFVGLAGTTALSVLLAWSILRYVDPGKLPNGCRNLSGLTKKTVALNYGRLIKMGAGRRDNEIWDNLLELLSGYCLPKAEITRETFCLQSKLKKHAKTAA